MLKKPKETVNRQQNNNIDTDILWDQIGFHKPLAGFWYKLIFSLFSIVVAIAISGIWFTYFYPYPESMGYKTAATGVFVLFFKVFDLGTNMTMDRYIAESRIKNPQKMIQYIQYFIWYQMITGLIQTTVVSIYALYIVPSTELGYAVWIMLIHSTTQYPGFLGVFSGVLNSLQHFNKKEVLNFVSGEIIQRITEILFLIWGRWWGANNPAIGEIMGIAIGSTIGLYVDDFIAMALSAYFFSKVMKNEGVSVRDCFRIDFDWKLVKETLIFGIKTGMPTIIGVATELIILWEWLLYVPQYTTFITLFNIAGGISGVLNQAMGVQLTMLISEAYMNGKEELTKYYMAQYWKFNAQVQGFLLVILMLIFLVLEPVFLGIGLENYIMAIPFIIPRIIREIQQPYTTLADNTVLGTNHPNWLMFIRFCEEFLKIVFMTLWIVWLRLPETYGIDAIIWIMPCGIYPAIIFKTVASFIYIDKKILKFKIPLWQSFGSTYISAIIIFILGFLAKITIFDYLYATTNVFIAVGVLIIIILLMMMGIFFPLTTLFGGWDDNSLNDFRKAAIMSGPSKFMVWPMYLGIEKTSKISKLHNRFGLSSELAIQEAQELLQIKHQNSIMQKK